MELENRLRGDAAGAGSARLIERIETKAPREELFSGREASGRDPYDELKTRVQRAVIAKLGPRLFGSAHATGIGSRDSETRRTPRASASGLRSRNEARTISSGWHGRGRIAGGRAT